MDRREGCIRSVLDPTHEQMEGGHGGSIARLELELVPHNIIEFVRDCENGQGTESLAMCPIARR
jgi:hypothetical protein